LRACSRNSFKSSLKSKFIAGVPPLRRTHPGRSYPA
jgi:hypothetical protein